VTAGIPLYRGQEAQRVGFGVPLALLAVEVERLGQDGDRVVQLTQQV